ncbi:transporter [Lachnoclostridium sp. Marseille-P6806]|uniref:transporter n=1 Tax=Lachnoclostridium sp. Marseille-P6806 TaxID=2364793 RepID=UPI00102F48C4|nr:transporter [Lachnoclostridium sp. Marseille-P6806]
MRRIRWKKLLGLQAIVMLFSLTSVAAKFASGQRMFSPVFFLFYGLELVLLAVYALLWQQAIKHFDISVAYANKAMTVLWGFLWGGLIFHDRVTPGKLAGGALVVLGVIVLNGSDAKRREEP